MLPETKEMLTKFIRMRDYSVQAKTITSIIEMCGEFSAAELPAALEIRLRQIAERMQALSHDLKGTEGNDGQPVQDDSGTERPDSRD
jgi:hypothetical protein